MQKQLRTKQQIEEKAMKEEQQRLEHESLITKMEEEEKLLIERL